MAREQLLHPGNGVAEGGGAAVAAPAVGRALPGPSGTKQRGLFCGQLTSLTWSREVQTRGEFAHFGDNRHGGSNNSARDSGQTAGEGNAGHGVARHPGAVEVGTEDSQPLIVTVPHKDQSQANDSTENCSDAGTVNRCSVWSDLVSRSGHHHGPPCEGTALGCGACRKSVGSGGSRR